MSTSGPSIGPLVALCIIPLTIVLTATVCYRSSLFARPITVQMLRAHDLQEAKVWGPPPTIRDVFLDQNEHRGGSWGWDEIMPLALSPPHLALIVRMPFPPTPPIDGHNNTERIPGLPHLELGICSVPVALSPSADK